MIETRILGERDDSVAEFIEKTDDALVQQTNEWRKAISKMGTDKDVSLVAENERGEIVGYLPAFLYENELGNMIQSNPYPASYGGVVTDLSHEEKEEFFKTMLLKLLEVAKDSNCVLSICTPPFKDDDYTLYKKYFQPDYEKCKFYQYIDFKSNPAGFEEGKFRNEIRENLVKKLRKAEKQEVKIEKSANIEDLIQWYEEIAVDRMATIGGNMPPLEWFKSLWNNVISRNKGEFLLTKINNVMTGGGVFVYYKKVIDIYLRIIKTEYLNTESGTYLDYHSIIDAQKRGFHYFNWQSSPSKSSSSYYYKSGWRPLEGTTYYLTKVTGDAKLLLQTSLEDVMQAYKWHFVLPYELFNVRSGHVES